MKAAVVTQFGPPEVLVTSEAPEPVAGAGEVVIEVVVADVLWVETAIRQGGGGDYFDVTPPYVPGNGVAGRVRAAGDGVDPGWVGREVVAHTRERGGYAEQVVVPSDGLSAVPDGLSLTEAAALLADGPTALASSRACVSVPRTACWWWVQAVDSASCRSSWRAPAPGGSWPSRATSASWRGHGSWAPTP